MVVFEDGVPARVNTAGSSSPAPPTTCRRSPRSCGAGSPAISTPERARRAGPPRTPIRTGRASTRPPAGRGVRLPAAAGGGRRRPAAGQRGGERCCRAGHRRRGGLRAGQAAGGGVAARRSLPRHAAAGVRGSLSAAAGAGSGPSLRDRLSPATAFEADDGPALDGVPGLGEIRRKALLPSLRVTQKAAGRLRRARSRRSRV